MRSASPRSIVVENLSKAVDGVTLLDSIDLTIQAGSTTALMGPNGAGKSVLLACLAGGLDPDGGDVRLDHRTADNPRETEPAASVRDSQELPREAIAYAPQGSMALPGLTGRETIEFYTALHPGATDRWRDLVARFEIESALEAPVRTYSGGMRRRLELAIVLSIDAEIYLLDEPTAALDMSILRRVHEAIDDRVDAGATVLFASHVPADVDLADRIAFLREGSIVTEGVLEELREALPPIARRDSIETDDRGNEPAVIAGRWVRGGDGLRGFLPPDAATGVPTVSPTPQDLFEYYTAVRPAIGERTAGGLTEGGATTGEPTSTSGGPT